MRKPLLLLFILISSLMFSQSYDAELVNQKTDLLISGNKLIKNHSFTIRINNRNGEEYSTISIPYSKISRIGKLEASILDKDNKLVRKLKSGEIIERSMISNSSFYEDDYVKEFTLKHNSYPYYICYSYQLQETEFLSIDYWSPVLSFDIPTLSAELTLTAPKNYKFRFRSVEVNSPEIDSVSEKNTVYTWRTNYTHLLKKESLAPNAYLFLPLVAIVPLQFKFHLKGSFESWDDFIDWTFRLNQGLDELPASEKAKILSIEGDEKDQTAVIRKLYHYLQDNTRYVNITIDKGGMKSYPASYVAENKFGDCKALTTYMKSMLSYVGIESYYTLVYAGSTNREIIKEFPSQQFNHVILYIPLDNDTIWLDCTSDGAFNNLGTFTQNREALVIDNKIGGFVRTPSLTPLEVREERKAQISLPKPDKENIRVSEYLSGYKFEHLLQLDQAYSVQDKDYMMRNYFVEKHVELSNYKITNVDRDSKTIKLEYQGKSNHHYMKFGDEYVVNNIPFSLPQLNNPEDRKLPVQIDYPICKTDTLIYEIPAGFELVNEPEKFSLNDNYGSYSIEFDSDEEQVRVVKKMLILPGKYELNLYPKFYDFMKIILNVENKKHIVFKPKKLSL